MFELKTSGYFCRTAERSVLCRNTITMDADIMYIADIFNHVDAGKFIAFDIEYDAMWGYREDD